tara:strand:- start:2912 stop:4132 length:1221 start_codon:yes stop_codon:yes gene_type:complete
MAIDYGNYVQQAGQGLDFSGLNKSVDNFLNKRDEGLQMQATKMSNDTWASYQKPWDDAMGADIMGTDNGATWARNVSQLGNQTPGQALALYKAQAQAKGDKFYNKLLAAGEFDPVGFKEKYEANRFNSMPGIEKKLEDYKKNNFISDDDMQLWMAETGMNKFIQKYGSDISPLKELSYPDQSWRQWFDAQGGKTGLAIATGTLGVGGYGGYKLGSNLYNDWANPKTSSRVLKGQAFQKNSAEALGKSQYGKDILNKSKLNIGQAQSFAKGNVSKAEKSLSKSQKMLKDAQAKFKKTNPKGKFKNVKLQNSVNKNIAKLAENKKLLELANKKVPQSMKTLVNRVVKKHGKAKLMRILAKKIGIRGAISIGAKLGLAAIPAGVTQVAAAGLLAWDVKFIYDTLNDLAE